MMRAFRLTALLAMGLLVASSYAVAQEAATPTSGGQVSISALGVDKVSSAKFQEYRDVPKGLSIPHLNLWATGNKVDFNLDAFNVRQGDQRYTGSLTTSMFGLSFDYNQVPHNMGNNGKTILSEVGTGVWAMSTSLQQYLQNTVEATTSANRIVTFYDALLAPSFQSPNSVDISGLRKRGEAALTLGQNLPLDLTFTYMRELKSGYRGAAGGGIYSTVSSVLDIPEPLDELTQDFGVRAAYNFKAGNVHAAFNRNVYNNRAETLTVDNPFQAYDTAYVSSVGGAAQARWSNAPDNEASTGSAGFLLKLPYKTRIGGDVALARWTQNAAFIPYTINSAILTPAGVQADSLSALQQKSFDGKIDTTTLNVTFSSRPVEGLWVRAQYRSYDLSNKTSRFAITGDVGASPDRTWSVVTTSADAQFGHATANVYDSKTSRFTGSVSYDLKWLTVEAQGRTAKLTRTSREATEGKDNGYAVSALLHPHDWVGVRASYNYAKRTAEGHTVYGFQMDEAERVTKRTMVDVEVTPNDKIGVTFAYALRDVTYPNRPDRIALSSGVPVAGAVPIPGTPSGLLGAKYDTFTAELELRPVERVELGAYYTYEKDRTENQWSTTTGVALNNLLNYKASDKTDTFGANAVVTFIPDKMSATFNAMRQKVDGLNDVTANASGAFYTARASVGGPVDIGAWDDTKLTTVTGQVDYVVAKDWKLGVGYLYEKYDFSDAYTAGNLLMPQSVLIFMKPDNGNYTANVVYAKLNYRF